LARFLGPSALVVVLAFSLAASSASAQAVLSHPSTIDFRELGPQSGSYTIVTEAWGVSAAGRYAVGDAYPNISSCVIDPLVGYCGLIASVWQPGSGYGTDDPAFLPFASTQDVQDAYYATSVARAIDSAADTIIGFSELQNHTTYYDQYDALAWTRSGSSWTAYRLNTSGQGGGRGVSDDGNSAVGWVGDLDSNGYDLLNVQGALWTRTGSGASNWSGTVSLGVLHSGDFSVANGVATESNGNRIVVGWSGTTSGCEYCVVPYGADISDYVFSSGWSPTAVFWTVNASGSSHPIKSLTGLLSGGSSDATAISEDGSTIVGWSQISASNPGDPVTEAVLWRGSGSSFASATPLGNFSLPSSLQGQASGATARGSVALAVSEHGDAVVGYEHFSYNEDFDLAYIWTSQLGKGRYLGDVLTNAGVKLGNWVLYSATGVRSTSDSLVIVGNGCPDGLNASDCSEGDPGYIARLGVTSSTSGITTPTQQVQSFNQISTTALDIGSTTASTLSDMGDMAQHHRCIRASDDPGLGDWCFYSFGSGGVFSEDDPAQGGEFEGDVGLAHYFTPVTSVGANIGTGLIDSDLDLDGHFHENDVHLGGYVSQMPDTGWRLFGAGLWGSLNNVDITRGYLNGVDIADSKGTTDGNGWGLLGWVGYGFRTGQKELLTPFAEVAHTDTHLGAYDEHGGPFPTDFQDIDTNTTTGQLGLLQETDVTPTIRVFTSEAWVHVLDTDNPTIKGVVLGIFDLSTSGVGNVNDWAEFAAGARYQLSARDVLSVSSRIDTEFSDFFAMSGEIGYSHIF
jgi:Autotransporter beta-domain